jgi:phosphate transport system protein
MRIHLDRDLSNLHRDLLGQASIVERAVGNAILALQECSATLARQVIAGDDAIDQTENDIEDECLKIIALHQPVATDLRRIASILKINADLERMADLATEISQRALRLTELKRIGKPIKLQQMADLTTKVMSMSVKAFIEMNAQLARRACRMDDQIDAANCEIIRDLIETMKKSPDLIEPALSLFSATRHLERIADYATNIAEDVIYVAEGTIVRHHPELLAIASTEHEGNT